MAVCYRRLIGVEVDDVQVSVCERRGESIPGFSLSTEDGVEPGFVIKLQLLNPLHPLNPSTHSPTAPPQRWTAQLFRGFDWNSINFPAVSKRLAVFFYRPRFVVGLFD